eukprot:1623712-Amphidinium_carterae.1
MKSAPFKFRDVTPVIKMRVSKSGDHTLPASVIGAAVVVVTGGSRLLVLQCLVQRPNLTLLPRFPPRSQMKRTLWRGLYLESTCHWQHR